MTSSWSHSPSTRHCAEQRGGECEQRIETPISLAEPSTHDPPSHENREHCHASSPPPTHTRTPFPPPPPPGRKKCKRIDTHPKLLPRDHTLAHTADHIRVRIRRICQLHVLEKHMDTAQNAMGTKKRKRGNRGESVGSNVRVGGGGTWRPTNLCSAGANRWSGIGTKAAVDTSAPLLLPPP